MTSPADSPPAAAPSKAAPVFVDRYISWVYDTTAYTLLALFRVYFRLRVRGLENIPKEGALLIASNHASHMDPIVIGVTVGLRRSTRYLAKQELFEIPVFGKYIARLGAVPVARGGADRAAVRTITDVLRRGLSALIFPEGTRTSDGELQPPKTGIGWMATHIEDAQILPCYIEGSFDAWPRGVSFPRPRRVTLRIGKPFRPSETQAMRAVSAREEGNSRTVGDGRAAGGEDFRAAGAKKRLYWELSEEIMTEIAKVQQGTSR